MGLPRSTGYELRLISSGRYDQARLSAAYKGVQTLLMREGARDFRSGQAFSHTTYFGESVDIHHISPRTWCQKQGIPRERYDTIVNKTPLSYQTNRIIGGEAPSIYLAKLPQKGGASREQIDQHLQSHLIAPSALRSDDFEGFLTLRREAFLQLIERSIRKPIYRGLQSDEPVADATTPEGKFLEAAE